MRIAVDFPAPFSPTIAWIVPVRTVILIWSLARTLPNRLLMFRSSSIFALLLHRVGHFDLAGNDFLTCLIDGTDRFGRKQVLVVLVGCVADTIVIETVYVDSANRAAFHAIAHDLIHRIVDAFDHARQHVARLHPILVGIDSNDELQWASLSVLTVLFDCIERADPGVAGCGKNNVGSFFDLCAREFLPFHWIVPCGIGYTDVVRKNAYVGIDGMRTLFVSNFELVDQVNIHASQKPERAGF